MRYMKKILVCIVFAVVGLVPHASAEFSLTEVVAMGTGTVACYIYTDDLDNYQDGDMHKVVNGEADTRYRNKRKMRKDIKRTRRQIRQADATEDTTGLESFLSDLQIGKNNFRGCARATIGSGSGGGDSGGGTDGGSGNTNNNFEACAVVTGDLTVTASNQIRIINGTKCSPDADTPTVELSIGCTGTKIADNAVLTAAHCTEGQSSMSITAGDGTVYHASALYTHPGYSQFNSPEATNDVALLVFDQSLAGIVTASIRNGISYTAGEAAVGGGYGYVNSSTQQTDGLYGVTYNIVSSDAEQVSTLWTPPTEEGIGTNCNGDSGGPLFVQNQAQNTWIVGGVVSNGANTTCGQNGQPDLANFAIPGNDSNKAFILQYVPSASFVD